MAMEAAATETSRSEKSNSLSIDGELLFYLFFRSIQQR